MKKKRNVLGLCIFLCMLMIPIVHKNSSSIIESIATHDETNANTVSTLLQEDTSKRIVIDAGHGGYDSGSISADGILEKDITLSISLQVGSLLEDAGYDVIYTRESDEVSWSDDNLDDLSTRVAIAENKDAAYFISIHTNASDNYNDGAYGFETYVDYSDSTILNIAQEISNNLTSLSYTQDRGLKSTSDSSLYVIDKNSVPALLLEIGFMSDSDDVAYMSSELGQANIAKAIADGIQASV
ncbi:MAG: N-acetylmuramoyl-L-alanine amidase [Longicatena sp.]